MSGFSVGIDLGGTKILTGVVNTITGELICSVKKKTKKNKGIEYILEKICTSVVELFEMMPIDIKEVSSIGLGVPGQLDLQKGIVLAAPNLGFSNINLKNIIEEKFSIPVFMGNDVDVAAIGEAKFGAGLGFNNFVCIFVGTGVGSGIIINNRLLSGVTGTAGEIGHVTVDFNGRPCGCGANGCLEAYASRTAIEKKILASLQKGKYSLISEYIKQDKPIKSNMIKKALEQNDALVTDIVDEAANYLGVGIASVINFLNPELIILGGGLIDKVDYFYNKSVKIAKETALTTPARKTIFKKAKLADYSGVIGAALLEKYTQQ